jgi:hypothetical protein
VAGSGDWRRRDGALVTGRGGELHGSVPCELRNREEEPKGEETQRRARRLAVLGDEAERCKSSGWWEKMKAKGGPDPYSRGGWGRARGGDRFPSASGGQQRCSAW